MKSITGWSYGKYILPTPLNRSEADARHNRVTDVSNDQKKLLTLSRARRACRLGGGFGSGLNCLFKNASTSERSMRYVARRAVGVPTLVALSAPDLIRREMWARLTPSSSATSRGQQ